jgi:anti-anti-sigma factor
MSTDWAKGILLQELSDEPALSEELQSVIDRLKKSERSGASHVVLNFSSVSYINSSNLSQLLRIRSILNEHGKLLKLCSVADEVWSVFMVSGLDKVFRFAPDPMTALAGLQIEAGTLDDA